MAKFKRGERVRQIMAPPIVGVVTDFAVDRESGEVQIQVDWLNEAGHTESTFFTTDQIELDPSNP